MNEQLIVEKLIKLSEGKLTANEWKNWFAENAITIEKTCGRTVFLKMKPKESFSEIRNVYIGQSVAIDWLKSKNIIIIFSDIYKNKWENEFENFCKVEKEKEIQQQKAIETKFSHIKKFYPKFFRQLSKSYCSSDIIEQGKNIVVIANMEKELSIQLSEDLNEFYQKISKLEFDGLNIDFDRLDLELVDNKKYLLLGEYWKYGDGDKLLFDVECHGIYVLAHEFNPPKLFKQTSSFKDFIEKEVVKHLKRYAN